MKKYFLSLLITTSFLFSCKREEQDQQGELITIHEDLRPLLYDVGSKWVYQDLNGNKDSAIIIGIDSNITTYNATNGNYIDMEVIELSYSPNNVLGDRQIFRSNYITDYNKRWSPAWSNLIYISNRSLGIGDSLCSFDECISLIEVLDNYTVQAKVYTDVSHFKANNGHEFWWDSSVGIVKYKTEQEDWELSRTHLIQ